MTQSGLKVSPVHVLDLAFYLPALIITGIWTLRGTRRGLQLAGPVLVSLLLITINIMTIFWFYRHWHLSENLGMLPAFAGLAVWLVLVAVWFWRQHSAEFEA